MIADHLGDGVYGVARFTAIVATILAIAIALRAHRQSDRWRRLVLRTIAALLAIIALRIYLDAEPVAEAADRFDISGLAGAIVGWPIAIPLAMLCMALLVMSTRETRRVTGF